MTIYAITLKNPTIRSPTTPTYGGPRPPRSRNYTHYNGEMISPIYDSMIPVICKYAYIKIKHIWPCDNVENRMSMYLLRLSCISHLFTKYCSLPVACRNKM